LQLSFYAVWFIHDLAPPGAALFSCAFVRNQGARAGNYVRASAFFRFSVGCRSPPVLARLTNHLTPKRRNKMFNRKSSYALNKKDPNAIVYMDANEVIIRLTREDFASEKEFLKWKALSDEDYHASEKEAHVYANHTLALDELSEEAASIPAVDVCMEQAHDRVAEIRRSTQKVTQIRKHLTDTQFRRMWMYFVDGMTIDEIGKVEGVSHQAISLNITAAIRKIKKYF